MELKMTRLKMLSAAAAIALVLPIALPSESFAQMHGGRGGGGAVGAHVGGGGGSGGFRGGAAVGGGGSFRAGPAIAGGGGARFSGGAARYGTGVSGGMAGSGVRGPVAGSWSGGARGPAYAGGNWSGGNWGGGYRHHRHGGFYPGFAAGALVGGALANSYAYYGGPDYAYGPDYGYYGDSYDDGTTVAVVPGGDDPASCAQRYRSYDPASQTYLGYDGLRHPCP